MMNYKILQSSTGVTFRMLACVLIFFGVLTDGNTAPQKVSDQAHGLVAYHSVTKPPLAANEVQATVSGRVTDAVSGEPLVGVTVIVEGTQTGTTTDMDGFYELNVPEGSESIAFSYVGYARQVVDFTGQNEINVELSADIAMLDDLVVVGYGVQRRSDITGSVGIATADQLEQPTFNTLQSLRGKVAGVNIYTNSGSPTGSSRVIIRGVGTINASTNPLYVVDGVVMENIDYLNPNDIESIEVLKDASATAIYGSRGANGVILVSTARGTSDGMVVSYNSDFSIGHMRGKMDLLNAEEFMEVLEIGYENAPKYNNYAPGSEPVLTRNDPRLFDANGNPLFDTDWQDEATRTAFSHNHQLGIQTGTERSSFGAFLNYTDREGIMLNSYMNRASLKIAYDANPRDWLTVGTNLTLGRTWENNIDEGGGHQMPRRTMIEMTPIFPVQFEDGSWSNSFTHADSYCFEAIANPVHVLKTQDRLRDRTQIFGNTFVALQLNEHLEFRTQIGIDNVLFEERNYNPTDLINISSPQGYAGIGNSEMLFWQNENYLTYIQEFDQHRVNAVLGASWQQRNYRSNNLSATGFSDNFFRFNNIGTATDPNPPSSYADDWTMNSYFARVNYNYADKYSFTFTGRVDGSSRFGANSKYGFFPSIGAAWLISEEGFLQDAAYVDVLRLRSSYGITGNSEIGLYQSLATIGSGTTLIGGERHPYSYVQRLANPDLEWEKTHQFNVGFELALFNQAVSLEGDYYYKLTNDLLLARPIPTTTGYGSITENIGSVSNRGVDFMITTRNMQSSDFTWTTTLNFNFNKNQIESLGAEDEDIFPGPNWVSGSQTILRVGEPVGSFWGFEREGIYGTDEADQGVPGTAKRSANRKILGNAMPDWTGSFINRFYYRNFDLTLDLQFVYGVDVMQQFLHSVEDRVGIANSLSTVLYDSWTENNQDAMVQQIRHAALPGQDSELDSRWIADGSYLRANLISAGYTFNPAALDSVGINILRITASVENAFVIHSDDFLGYDPEATSWGGNQWSQNIFFFQYPKPRTFSLGVNLQF